MHYQNFFISIKIIFLLSWRQSNELPIHFVHCTVKKKTMIFWRSLRYSIQEIRKSSRNCLKYLNFYTEKQHFIIRWFYFWIFHVNFSRINAFNDAWTFLYDSLEFLTFSIKLWDKHLNVQILVFLAIHIHCVKSVRFWNYSGPYSVRLRENTDRNSTKYKHFPRSDIFKRVEVRDIISSLPYKFFAKIVSGWKPLTIFTIGSMLDVLISRSKSYVALVF